MEFSSSEVSALGRLSSVGGAVAGSLEDFRDSLSPRLSLAILEDAAPSAVELRVSGATPLVLRLRSLFGLGPLLA